MFERFRKAFPIAGDKWKEYTSRFQRMEVPAKTVLLKEGEVAKKLFLIEKGCIRAWFNNDGKDVTVQFFFENNLVASVESFRKRIPSPVFIETLEPSVLWYLPKKEVDAIVDELIQLPLARDKLVDFLFNRTFAYMKHSLSFLKDTPVQRYLNLMEEKPQIIKRVPQRYIASYLGISTVHLSRIKNKLAKKRRS